MSRKQTEEQLSEVEQKYRTLVEQIPGVVYVSPINNTTKVAYISPQLQQLLGIAPEDWNFGFFNSWLDYTHPNDRDRLWQAVNTTIATGEPLRIEYRMIRRDGRIIWVRNQANLVFCADGQTQLLQGLVFDISDVYDELCLRKQVQESEARYRTILEDQTELIARGLPDGTVTFVNEAFCRFFGLKREEIIAQHYQPVVFEEDRERVFSLVNSISLENPVITIENRAIACEGVRWTQWIVQGIFDEQGMLVELQSVGRDITERKLVEQALSENEQKFRAIFNQTIQFMGLLQPNGIVLEINQTALDFAGINREEVVGKPFWEAKWWTISLNTQEQLKTAIIAAANGESIRYEVEILGRDAQAIAIDFSLRPILDESGRITLLISEGRDITEYQAALQERRKAEEALRSSQDFLQKVANTVPHILYLFDLLKGTSVYLNEKSATVLGYSPEEFCNADPHWFINCFHPDDRHLCYDIANRFVNLNDNEVLSTEYRFRHKNGEWRWLNTREVVFARDANGSPTQILGSVEDISTRKEAEVMLRQQAEGERLINEELQRLATLDGLTQIANRRRFDEYLESEWQRLKREQLSLSLILLDVDFFKLYNDTYGHLGGDDCLRQLASALKNIVKRPADLVARYGGEEFTIILPNTEIQGAIYVAQTIRQAVRDLAIPHAQSRVCDHVTVSLGVVSIVPNSEISPPDLINAADKALYVAKQQGRDQVHAVSVVIPS
ncbi:MAG: PAS domain S-box protein [Nostoc sp. JL31]|uniref:sensor domain-containing diguanylate cyclase n=1 Tax=Nostoc sp. JL31 TaxID=2815395 RepID=UPI0025CFBBF2|nr:PAS domain S-box protein [Nostoc sp. JL31]MBN3889281.1 PAS domain S-box protein [Nostoc sp. JL31]